MTSVKFYLGAAGHCTAQQNHAQKGTANETIKFFATFAHIEHPTHGHVLFDTGYTRRFHEYTKKFPFNIYAKATKVFIQEEEEVVAILHKKGIQPESIKYIILSHFHADHIGGLKDFPNAKIFCSQSAWADVRHRKGIAAVRRAFIPSLLPEDFSSRLQTFQISDSPFQDVHLGKVLDLFEDGSILLCQLEGHAKGQIGALIKTEKQKIFLIADAAWLKENYTELRLPSPIVKLFFDSWTNYKDSLQRINQFHKANPAVAIIPCHCEQTYKEFIKNNQSETV